MGATSACTATWLSSSWRQRALVERSSATAIDGLSTSTMSGRTRRSAEKFQPSLQAEPSLEFVTLRLPSPLLDRARKDSEERGRPFAHSIRAALEIFFFHDVAREMAQTMTDDMKELGLTREDYFRSLLDARYRQLIAKQTLAAAKKRPVKGG